MFVSRVRGQREGMRAYANVCVCVCMYVKIKNVAHKRIHPTIQPNRDQMVMCEMGSDSPPMPTPP